MRAVIVGASALALCLGGSLGVLHAADPPAVTIAVLRGDGILVPVVTRTGDRWVQTWPTPTKAADVPLGLDGVPKRWWGKPGSTTTWHAWQIDGTASSVAVERPTWYLAHCQQGVGLKTALTARPPLPPPTVQPYPKLGLAATGKTTFRRIEPIDQSDPIWARVADRVDGVMDQAEAGMNGMPLMTVDGPRPTTHPVAAEERAKVPTRVESLYRLALPDGGALFYVEATKRYGMPQLPAERVAPAPTPRDGCSVMTFGNGFFVVGPDGVVPRPKLETRLSGCDYDEVSLLLPLGAIDDPSGSPVWIGQITGWTYESFAGFRWNVQRNQIDHLFQTHGGWCVDE